MTRPLLPPAAALLLALAAPPTAAAPPAATSGAEAWEGSFALQLRLATHARIPVLGTQHTQTVSLLRVELRREGSEMVQRHEVCAVEMRGSRAVEAIVPDAFLRALPPRLYPARLTLADGQWRYTADMGPDAIGFDPGAGDTPLPRSRRDAAVRDSDGDGHPGATIVLRLPAFGTARIFVVQRSHLVLHGRQSGAQRIDGSIEIRVLEQRAIGAEPGIFSRTPAIRPDPQRSGFSLVRVAPGSDCASLRGNAAALFGTS